VGEEALRRPRRRGAGRLSAEPTSKRYFVATTIAKEPLQSATALPKNAP